MTTGGGNAGQDDPPGNRGTERKARAKWASSGLADQHVVAQIVGQYVAAEQAQRLRRLAANAETLQASWKAAADELVKLRDFVGVPEGILGNDQTKHGEIAEHVEVAVRRAWDLLAQRVPTAVIDGVPRTGPVDYVLDGVDIQSKFYNGSKNTLAAVLKHLREHPGGDIVVPRDQLDEIQRVVAGEEVGISARLQRTILARVDEIGAVTGRPFDEVVRPSVSSYSEVQRGAVDGTIENHEKALELSRREQATSLDTEAGPSLGGAGAAAALGAAVGGVVQITGSLYAKYREGKKPFTTEFTTEDWKDVGLSGLEGSAKGGVSAGAIYALTNCADMAAPFAGAFVSSAMTVQSLHSKYRAGEIEFDEFVELGQLACAEGAVVGLATALGQGVIPVPILGALVGAAAGKLLTAAAKNLSDNDGKRLQAELSRRYARVQANLDQEQRRHLDQLEAEFDRLGELTDAAFDLNANVRMRLLGTIELALAYGVPQDEILRNENDVDAFMTE